MLGLAPLALCVWASSNGRPLHSGPFSLRDKTSRPPRAGLYAPLPPRHNARLSWFKPAPDPGMNPASRAATRIV